MPGWTVGAGRYSAAVVLFALVGMAGLSDRLDAEQSKVRVACVRGMDPGALRLLEDAQATSPTVARLVARLEASDVIVMTSMTIMADGLAGDTRFLTVTATARIVCVRIDRLRSRSEQMAWLAHELQHAVEIADAPEVRTEADLVTLLKHIGRSRGGGRLFETDAAVECGRQTRREVASAR